MIILLHLVKMKNTLSLIITFFVVEKTVIYFFDSLWCIDVFCRHTKQYKFTGQKLSRISVFWNTYFTLINHESFTEPKASIFRCKNNSTFETL